MKKQFSIFIFMCLVFCLFLTTLSNGSVFAKNANSQDINSPVQNKYYTVIKDDGTVEMIPYEEEVPQTLDSNDYKVKNPTNNQVIGTYDTYEEAKQATKKNSSKRMARMRTNTPTYEIETYANTQDIKYGVARIIGYTSYVEYDGTNKGRSGYTHGQSANDAAYVSTSDDGKTIRVKQAGVFMDIPADNVEVTEYSSQSQVSYYLGDNNGFYHYYYSGKYGGKSSLNKTQVGYRPNYLQNNVKYYSYDGHYFYQNYTDMINDYQSGINVHTKAVNINQPYYNYYQYLSLRAPTTFTAEQLNQIIENAIKKNDTIDDSSKLKNQGQALLNNQNENGINASLMLGVSINESAWGMSYYAQDRNNLFGIGAVDSNPDNARRFDTVEDCFKYFSYNTISTGYLYFMDWRYRGPHLGDKLSGVNVKYASDPYWGEKAASFSYLLNELVDGKDYENFRIAINTTGKVNFYNSDNFSKKISDSTSNSSPKSEEVYEFPVTIKAETSSAYQVYSDSTLNDSRTSMQNNRNYIDTRDHLFVKKGEVNGRNVVLSPNQYLKGDVNGDGKVSSLDYIKIKNHIMATKNLVDDELKRADVNGDNKISSLDYIKIKNHIMGTNKLF